METIRFVAGTALIAAGLVIFTAEIVGNYRFGYVLDRMQAASLGDSFGLAMCLLGLMFYAGWSLMCLKLLFVELFLWFSSPASAHMLAKLEADTNEDIEKECDTECGEGVCRD